MKGRRVTVTLDEADALSVGLSLRSLNHAGRIPSGAIGPCDRVGQALVKAATGGGVENPPVEVSR